LIFGGIIGGPQAGYDFDIANTSDNSYYNNVECGVEDAVQQELNREGEGS
jgi:hypothetical protein